MFGNYRKIYLLFSLTPIVGHILLFLFFSQPYFAKNSIYIISVIIFYIIGNAVLLKVIFNIRDKKLDYIHKKFTMVINWINVSLRLLSNLYLYYILISYTTYVMYYNLFNTLQAIIGGLIILIFTQGISFYDKIYTIKYYEILFEDIEIYKYPKLVYVILQFVPILDVISFLFCVCINNKNSIIFKLIYIVSSLSFFYVEICFIYFKLLKNI